MLSNISIIRRRWPVLAVVAVLLLLLLAAGTLFAANEREDLGLLRSSGPVPLDEHDPGMADEAPALMVEAELPENEAGSGVSQVTSESDGSEALAQWLADRPEVMGPFTVEEAMSADSQTVDWLLYQAVYKEVMTQDEADTFQAWYDQRPSSEAAPELLNHQPAYLDRPNDQVSIREMFKETGSR